MLIGIAQLCYKAKPLSTIRNATLGAKTFAGHDEIDAEIDVVVTASQSSVCFIWRQNCRLHVKLKQQCFM